MTISKNQHYFFIVDNISRMSFLRLFSFECLADKQAYLFLVSLYIGLYFEVCKAINDFDSEKIKQLEINFDEEVFLVLSGNRHSTLHVPDDMDLYQERRSSFHNYLTSHPVELRDNISKLVRYALDLTKDNSWLKMLWITDSEVTPDLEPPKI